MVSKENPHVFCELVHQLALDRRFLHTQNSRAEKGVTSMMSAQLFEKKNHVFTYMTTSNSMFPYSKLFRSKSVSNL